MTETFVTDPPTYITTAGLARLLETTPKSIRNLVAAGRLPEPIRFTSGMVRFDLGEVRRHVAKLRVPRS
jgi:hypothetical protein